MDGAKFRLTFYLLLTIVYIPGLWCENGEFGTVGVTLGFHFAQSMRLENKILKLPHTSNCLWPKTVWHMFCCDFNYIFIILNF